ncbi:MAG: alpha/beta fold hydrolase [Candidatus Eisenbacteria bacterium]|nr:alpha/beta fold hydrolase [Candidatus Latescibacterota bacterium]MBD3300864.1 alpha/beta fold hydrolase [Candidatus Eisenbacteria bacterium]
MRTAAAIALFTLLAGASPAQDDAGPTSLGAPTRSEEGPPERVFRLFHFGDPAGEERFRVVAIPGTDTLRVEATSEISLAGRAFSLSQTLFVGRDDAALGRYHLEATVDESPQQIRADRAGDSIIVAAAAPTGRFRRSFHRPDPVVLLDNLLANHLVLLGEKIARSGFRAETIDVAVPQAGTLLPAEVDPGAPEPDGGREVRIRLGGITELLRFDPDGAVVEIEVPAQSLLFRAVDPSTAEERRPDAIRPPSAPVPEQAADPARVLYEERVVSFVSRGTDMTGLLTLPRGRKIPYPGVLLIPGSGPVDRDATVGANRPFLEIARGLAVFGIASLRFDKRTLVAPNTLDPVYTTVEQEVIADAVAAVEALRSHGGIDRRKIVILGHSMGGALAPVVAARSGPVAGLILMAATPRPLDVLLEEQLHRRIDAPSGMFDAIPGQTEEIHAILARLDSLRDGTLPDRERILGGSAYYLRDYRERDFGEALRAFPGPTLILQGGKDAQVTETDFALWKRIVDDTPEDRFEFRLYPELGHLFHPIPGEPGPEAETMPSEVDPAVIADIARFIQSLQ